MRYPGRVGAVGTQSSQTGTSDGRSRIEDRHRRNRKRPAGGRREERRERGVRSQQSKRSGPSPAVTGDWRMATGERVTRSRLELVPYWNSFRLELVLDWNSFPIGTRSRLELVLGWNSFRLIGTRSDWNSTGRGSAYTHETATHLPSAVAPLPCGRERPFAICSQSWCHVSCMLPLTRLLELPVLELQRPQRR
jgi:hypothetical protein